MSAYIVATVRVTDPVRFADYQRGIAGLSARHGGELIVRGIVDEILEGDAVAGERVVVSRFPDAAAARAYTGSVEYRAAAIHRLGAADVTMRLIVDPA